MQTLDILLIAGILIALVCVVLLLRGSKKKAANGPANTAETALAATVAEPAAEAPQASSPFLPSPEGEADDLSQIKGIGPKLSARLAELGVFHYGQIAGWSPAQLAEVDAQLGTFAGRPERDQWQSQARLLAAGDLKAYERVHGKIGPAA